MKPKLALAAKSIIVDRESEVPSAIGIMENINAEGFPFIIPEIAFLTVWCREEGDDADFEGELTVFIEDEIIVKQGIPIAFRAVPFTRNVTTFRGIPILKAGKLEFQIKVKDAVAKYHINIVARNRTKQESKQNEPNKAVEPTPMAVTDAAAQPPRQP